MTAAAHAVLTKQQMLLPVTCWCERTTVHVPVQWVSEARTGSCGPNCGPGCPSNVTDQEFDNTNDWDDSLVPQQNRNTKMKQFRADQYDPRPDSSRGYARSDTREQYPNDLILEVESPSTRLCPCGCAETPTGKKATFKMGHDVRLKGKLSRACAAGVQVVLTDEVRTICAVLDPVEYAKRFSTDKADWAQIVTDSAARAKKGGDAERAVLARAVGPQVGDTKLIKVGRWQKTGKILAVYEDGKGLLYEYVDGKGQTQQVRQDADGKIRPVA